MLWIDGEWVYDDTREPYTEYRPCKRCSCRPTDEGHDACIGSLPNVSSACCGHGVEKAFVMKESE